MKILIQTVFLYLIILVAFIALSIIYNQPALLIFIFAFILLIPVSVIIFSKICNSFEFHLSSTATSVETDNDVNFLFSYENKSVLPLFTANVIFHAENRYFPNNAKQTLSIPLSSRKNQFRIPITTSEIGLVTLKIEKIIIHDYMCIVKKEYFPHLELSVPVIPPKGIERDIPAITPQDGLDEFEESEYKGNVSSDVKEIREYRPGDRLQRVHWKLSAKLDDLFVKEMAHTSSLSIVILPELDKENINNTIKTLISCIDTLNQREDRFELCAFNNNTFEFTYFSINGEDTLIEALTFLYCQPLYEGKDIALSTYEASVNKPTTIIHIVGNRISLGETSI